MDPSLSVRLQEGFVFALVAVIAGRTMVFPFLRRMAHPLSLFLLRSGRVKWAMRFRAFALGSSAGVGVNR
jgi:hypothetical protein